MCLGIPGQIVSITDRTRLTAIAEIAGLQSEVNLAFVVDGPLDRLLGQWALFQGGFAASLLTPEDAQRTLRALRELGEAQEWPGPARDSGTAPDGR